MNTLRNWKRYNVITFHKILIIKEQGTAIFNIVLACSWVDWTKSALLVIDDLEYLQWKNNDENKFNLKKRKVNVNEKIKQRIMVLKKMQKTN